MEDNIQNNQNNENTPKPPINKKILFGFIGMGAVIVALVVALIAVAVGGKDGEDPSKADTSSAAESSSEAEEESSSEKEEDSEETQDTDSDDESSEEDSSDSEDSKKEGYVLTYSAGNGWEDGDKQMCSLEMSIASYDEAVSGWELVLEVEELRSCDGWNGTFKVSGNTLTVTNADYNGDISKGGNVVIGCNIGTGTSLNIKSAKLNGNDCTIEKGKVAQNSQSNDSGDKSTADVSELLERTSEAEQGDDWLYTDGNKIVDKDGKQVWLTGVNWFGYNTGTNTFDGLWTSELEPTVEAIADHGFNLIRVPISAELINQWADGEYPQANYNNAYNEVLNDMNSLEIFDYFLKLAEENGIKVMPDIHCAETDPSGHNVNLWYTDEISAEDYYDALEWMAERYKNNDTIIAFDLKNEPHGKPNEGDSAAIWNDSTDDNNWKYAAETAAKKILAKNPNVLIMVEGTEIYPKDISENGDYSSTNSDDYYFNWWGGNLRGVADYPVDLGDYQNKLVYSPHDYGPAVYAQPWFEGNYTYDSLMKDCWQDNWLYIQKENIAPLLIGEWGGFMTEPNLTWMTYMRKLISTYHLNHTFWCLNANSGDTGGLLLDDFTTWDEEKYEFVKEVLWQEDGKFVGLDHEIPLGDNGITLSEAEGL